MRREENRNKELDGILRNVGLLRHIIALICGTPSGDGTSPVRS